MLASGHGSTLQALLDACAAPAFGAVIVAVGVDRAGTRAEQRAAAAGVPVFTVRTDDGPDRADFDRRLAAAIAGWSPDLVVCAGYLKILGEQVLARFPVVNTHPSLLPAFPGMHAVRQALAAGVSATGVTVHRVDAGVDTGPVLAQREVPVLPGDTEETLRDRIQAVERPLFVETVRRLATAGGAGGATARPGAAATERQERT